MTNSAIMCGWCGKKVGEGERKKPAICDRCFQIHFPRPDLVRTILEVDNIEDIYRKEANFTSDSKY